MDQQKGKSGSFFSELRRRRVIHTCLLYVLLCWSTLQVGDIVFPAIGYNSDIASRYLLYLGIVGFPVTFALAWFFQFSSQGILRTHSFVERRVLTNLPPINERRHSGVSDYFHKRNEYPQFKWILSAETGPLSGLSFGVDRPLIVGRALDCDIAIVNPQVSRHHARLDLENDQLYVEDLGSSNGTMVNGKPVITRQELCHEDEVYFHDIIFRVTESFVRPRNKSQSMNQTTFVKPPRSAETPDNSDT